MLYNILNTKIGYVKFNVLLQGHTKKISNALSPMSSNYKMYLSSYVVNMKHSKTLICYMVCKTFIDQIQGYSKGRINLYELNLVKMRF